MDYERAKLFLSQRNQIQLLDYYDQLDEEKRRILLDEIEKLNFTVVKNINKSNDKKKVGKLKPIQAKSIEDIDKNREKYEEEGLKLLRENKVGAVLLAGGQGSRLGFSKPKGMFDIGETRPLFIFEILMNNIKEVTAASGRNFPVFIMTSVDNYDETAEFFNSHDFFGYPKDKVHFYKQDTEPACDFDGKIFLSEKHRVLQSPNGNGGWYSSLINSGLNRVLEREGIEWLNVFGVDNVLQKICDPAFIGATSLSRTFCGAKVVKKTCPKEKVGILCEQDGKPSIVEYYEMPQELAQKRTRKGELVYRYGVILNYLFNVHVLNATLSWKLPYHQAVKAITHIENGETVVPKAPNGYKFETLVVDMVKYMGNCLAYEVDRNKEFAPVKNKEGVDSVNSARELLKANGYEL